MLNIIDMNNFNFVRASFFIKLIFSICQKLFVLFKDSMLNLQFIKNQTV